MPPVAHGQPEAFLHSLRNLRRQRDHYSRFLRGLFLHKHSLLTNHSTRLFAVSQITQQLIGALYAVEAGPLSKPGQVLFHTLLNHLFDEAFEAIQVVKQAFLDAGLEHQDEQLTTGLTGALLEARRAYRETRTEQPSPQPSPIGRGSKK